MPWISLFLFLLGLFSFIFGIVRWWSKQRLLDERDELTNKKLKKELEKLSYTEVVDKVVTEYETAVEESDTETLVENTDNTEFEQYVQSYFTVENTITTKFAQYFTSSFRVMKNYRFGHYEYDIILQALNIQEEDRIIEVKFLPHKFKSYYIKDTLTRLAKASKAYQDKMNKKVKSILIIVLSDSEYNLEEIEKFKASQLAQKYIQKDNFSIEILNQNTLNELSKESLTTII